MGRSAAAGAGQPGRRAQARLRHHPGRRGDDGRPAQRGHPVCGDCPAGGARPDRAARVGRPPPAVPHHDGRRRGAGPAVRADEQGRLGGQGAAGHPPRLGRRMRPPAAPPVTRVALALYPPSWRARYGDEVLALLEESGGGPAAVASLAWRALPAWFCPPRHLHDRPARMRASLATALMSWSMLAGLGLVFAQLTQLQGLTAPGHPELRWAYAVFDVTLAASALVAGLGGLPLWLLMLRHARREQRTRDVAYLLLPVLAPVAYLAALIVTARLAGGANGVSPGWFGVITLAGFAAAATAAAGPGLALRRLQPRGPALRLAATAAGVSAAVMALAAVAIVIAVISLNLWARQFAGYHDGTVSGIYLALVVTAATVTTVSVARGTRAALARP